MSFTDHDIGAYQGKEVEVWMWDGDSAFSVKQQLRGAQNFNTTEEQPESRVSELGYEATKAVYGAATYSVSVTLVVRDLVQIARLSGLSPSASKRLIVSEFKPINCVAWYRDPDTKEVNVSKYAGGFKARTASTPAAVEANAQITLEGAADLIGFFDGKVEVIQYAGDGSTAEFDLPAGVTEDEVVLAESPSGTINDDYTYNAASGLTPVSPSITFDTAPANGSVVRIVYQV